MWDGSIASAINITQTGVTVFAQTDANQVWTGTIINGTGSNPLGDSFVINGNPPATAGNWISSNAGSPNLLSRIYGISGTLTAPQTTPEPSSLLGFITLGGLMLGGAAVKRARK